ncbi:hypothetical protein E3T54_10245 [Cryobacterium sp. Sr8]|uniref:hypothetical protein n=1 Tax=Cryobacterium sp. Sr8 TaxID=1259203 RepID=UPI001069D913|nr:hypothetical protein [Cryobacterium sp. Sr8]TFD76551.1 hypothetical protein E3T54_10245 [Cryobacterium sp. Sr8]
MNDVDLSAIAFPHHPAGWRSPSDLVAGFTLAWALELRERTRLSPFAPFANGVRDQLPAQYRFDTLGKLITLSPGATGTMFGRNSIARLTALCGAWQLFEELNRSWHLRSGDFGQFADTLAYVTGGNDRPSLYRDLSADLSKCLLAIRLRRASSQHDQLDLAEEWFITGDEDLTFEDSRGTVSLLFHFSNLNQVPVGLFSHSFVETVWSTARVTVDRLGPDRVVEMHREGCVPVSGVVSRC